MSPSQLESQEQLTSAVDVLRRETERLALLGDLLGRAESDWFGKFQRLEESRRRTERSRRKLAARAARLRRQRQRITSGQSPAAGGAMGAAGISAAADAELSMLRSQLAEAVGMLESLRDARRTAETQHRREVDDLRDRLTQQETAERELRETLETLREASDGDGPLEELRHQLGLERIRCEELESQNASLATQLATTQVNGQISATMSSQSHESLSWEERKAAILRQLHREDADEPLDATQRESLRDVVAKTDREIQRRDAEIAELQQLLEHQSTTVGESVAVGAAAIAQMIDADDLVREEREKLQAIKSEWQDKLRQAEIDLSLERAKLARERRELEQRYADLERQLAEAAELKGEATATDQPRRRRWLTQLGISEED